MSAYSPFYYCAGCGKQLGYKSHGLVDSLGESCYEDRYCRSCEQEELDALGAEFPEEEDWIEVGEDDEELAL